MAATTGVLKQLQTKAATINTAWRPTSSTMLAASEMALLQSVVKSPFRASHVKLASGEFINTLEVHHPHEHQQRAKTRGDTLVLAHGFGSGLGMWAANLDTLASGYKQVVAFDWLGMGGSSRPKFKKRTNCSDQDNLDWALAFFTDSMEEWASRMRLGSFTLVGHSLGGYLVTNYAKHHPHRVHRLILASPVGIPSPMMPAEPNPRKLPFGLQMLQSAWNSNVTPQQIIRALGPYGPGMLRRAVFRRFGALASSNAGAADLVAAYLYHITASPGSGEYAMNSLLEPNLQASVPGVYARRPMLADIAALPMPVDILFGDHDWMYHPHVPELLQPLSHAKLHILKSAGHHLYLDNPEHFHALLL